MDMTSRPSQGQHSSAVNAAEYTEALVQADKDFRELTYTNRNHSIYGGNTRAHLFRQITSHFKQYLQ